MKQENSAHLPLHASDILYDNEAFCITIYTRHCFLYKALINDTEIICDEDILIHMDCLFRLLPVGLSHPKCMLGGGSS